MPTLEAIFKPVIPDEAVATFVLIKNSQVIVHYWSDLYNHHLPTLLETVRLANLIMPVSHIVDIFKDSSSVAYCTM